MPRLGLTRDSTTLSPASGLWMCPSTRQVRWLRPLQRTLLDSDEPVSWLSPLMRREYRRAECAPVLSRSHDPADRSREPSPLHVSFHRLSFGSRVRADVQRL